MGIAVVGNAFVDIKGFPEDIYVPKGRNAGKVEIVHGGVGRNVAEDIANVELRPMFVSMVDDDPQGEEVVNKLRNHKVNTDYIVHTPDGMGMWLAVFDHQGDVVASISKRPKMEALAALLEEKGDEIFSSCDSVVLEIDMEKDIVKQVFRFARKYSRPVYGVVANMSIAGERRDLIRSTDCFVCNQQEAGMLFLQDYSALTPEELAAKLSENISSAGIRSMVVTMGEKGSVYADLTGICGVCPSRKVPVIDTTGAGDAFCAGLAVGLTYGKSLPESVEIGTHLASSVIMSSDNVCPRFQPQELGIDINI